MYSFLLKVFVTIILVLPSLYFGRKALILLCNVLCYVRDHFVLWNVAFGATSSRRNISHNLRLHAYVCKTVLLDASSLNELFIFAKGMVSSDITVEQFHRVLLGYKFIIICRERIDGSLRGMCLLDQSSHKQGDQSYNVIKVGLALFNKLYQGGPLLYYIFFYHILKVLLLHPSTPLYIMGKCFSYKSYLALAQTLNHTFPCYNHPFPEFERSLLLEFANSVVKSGEIFNPETFVLQREISHVKDFVAPISDEQLQNPHIKFFIDQNPGWANGHCMFFISPITIYDVLNIFKKALQRALGIRKSKGRKGEKQKQERIRRSFDRHFSFQCPDTKDKMLQGYDLDSLGNVVPMFGTIDDMHISDHITTLREECEREEEEGEMNQEIKDREETN